MFFWNLPYIWTIFKGLTVEAPGLCQLLGRRCGGDDGVGGHAALGRGQNAHALAGNLGPQKWFPVLATKRWDLGHKKNLLLSPCSKNITWDFFLNDLVVRTSGWFWMWFPNLGTFGFGSKNQTQKVTRNQKREKRCDQISTVSWIITVKKLEQWIASSYVSLLVSLCEGDGIKSGDNFQARFLGGARRFRSVEKGSRSRQVAYTTVSVDLKFNQTFLDSSVRFSQYFLIFFFIWRIFINLVATINIYIYICILYIYIIYNIIEQWFRES